MKFSVIIPVYNAEWSVERAIRSVIEQTLPAQEIIIVDDGSTDKSISIASSFGEAVKIFKQRHSGQAAARNKGVASASSEWICFLDADDWYYPNRLLRFAGSIERDPLVECIFGAYDLRRPDGTLLHVNLEECEAGRRIMRRAGRAGETKLYWDDLYYFGEHDFGHPNTFCVKKHVFLKLGGFPVEFEVGEDKSLWMACAAYCTEIGVISQSTACHVQHPNSTFKRGSLEANKQTVKGSASFVAASGDYPAPLRRGLKRRLRRDRLNLAYAFARSGRKRESIITILPNLWDYPSLGSIKEVVSIIRG